MVTHNKVLAGADNHQSRHQKQIDVFIGPTSQPQHLAVQNEHKLDQQQYRAVCGANTTGLEVQKLPPNDVKVSCPDCAEQLKLWKDIHT